MAELLEWMTSSLRLTAHTLPFLFHTEMLGDVMLLSETLGEQFFFFQSSVTYLSLVNSVLWLLVTLWPLLSVLGPS